MTTKNAARKAAQRAVPAGAGCSMCGKTHWRLGRHHHDYGKPLDVTILCPSCHSLADRESGHQRRAKLRVCRRCRMVFNWGHSRVSTCSRACASDLSSRAALRRWAGRSTQNRCLGCNEMFQRSRPRDKTCSRACLLLVKSRNALQRHSRIALTDCAVSVTPSSLNRPPQHLDT